MAHSSLQCCFSLLRFAGICSSTVPPQYFNRLEVWILTGHCNILILLVFSHFVVDLLVCLRSLSCCMTQFQPSFSCWADGLTFDSKILWYAEEFMADSMTAKCPGYAVAKQVQVITPSPLCLAADMRCLY